MVICPICGNDSISKLIELKYIGVSTYKQNLMICPRCGLICSKEKFNFEYNIMSFGKDNYLEQRIYDFFNKKLRALGVNNFDFELSHIKQENCKFEICSDSEKGKTIQIVSEYLEHEIELSRTISTIFNKQTDYIFIETPVYDFFSNDSINLFGYFIKTHNYYYSFYTIKAMMDRMGYTLLNFEFVVGNNFHMPMIFPCMLSLWGKNQKEDIQISFHSDINIYINQCKKEQDKINQKINKLFLDDIPIAIWGTGNYAEKLMGMTTLQDKNIVKIYDGNKQKLGEKFNNIVITEFNKKDLNNGMVKKILIASNTASNEIKKMIIEKYGVEEKFLVII